MSKARYRTTRKEKQRGVALPIMIGVGLVLLIAGGLILRQKPDPRVAIEVSGAPSLDVDPPTIDFGDVKLGKTVTAVFELSNVGDQTLEFVRVPYVEVIEGC
jgi:hypothetical protein